MIRRALAATVLVATLTLPAAARTERRVGWTLEQVWPTAVRYLRVDEHAKIVEKDEAAGYLLFERPDGDAVQRGALEVLVLEGRVRVVMTLEAQPDYVEAMLLERLERKLRAEHGPARARPAE